MFTEPQTYEPPRTGSRFSWKSVPKNLGFLLLDFPIALIGFVLVITLLSLGVGTLITVVGVFILYAGLLVAKGFGALELRRLRIAGMPAIASPIWKRGTGSLWNRTKSMLTSRDAWRYAAHAILNFVVATVTWSLTITWIALIINGPTHWMWSWALPVESRDLGDLLAAAIGLPIFANVLSIIINLVAGIVAAITLPWVTGSLMSWHQGMARLLLGRFTYDDLEDQVDDLASARTAATTAEGRALRKLERDIHDGPQQQLLRVQMDLAAAKRRIADDPQHAAALIDEASTRSSDALNELRDLSRGFAPPLLQDRGLAVAVEALAERNTIHTQVTDAVNPAIVIEPAIQQGVYFTISELFANATKHSEATRITTVMETLSDGDPSLHVVVTDNGKGGATQVTGHGLEGLHERVRGLGGSIDITSPIGGPTTATLSVPLPQ